MLNIEKEKILAVEGVNDARFFESILETLSITDVQVIHCGGKNNFKKILPEITLIPNFKSVRKFAVIGDADVDNNSAFQSVRNILKNTDNWNLIPPKKINSFSNGIPDIGIFIVNKPGQVSGKLEDLCLDAMKDSEAMKCVEKFWDCVQYQLTDQPKDPSKAKCQVYCAAMPELAENVGIAAKKKYWDFSSEVFDDLKDFLNNFEN